MVDETLTPPAASIDAPPEPTPPAEPVDALDPDGVPWKNRLAEANRKQAEAEASKAEADALNQQYAVELGKQRGNQPAPPPAEPLEDKFDEATLRMVDERAERKAYELARRSELAQVLEDTDIRAEAVVEYNALNLNPAYSGYSEIDKQFMATNSARATVAERRAANPPDPNAPPPVMEPNRATASVPATRPSTVPSVTPDDPDANFKAFWSDPVRKQGNEGWFRSVGYFNPIDPNSEDMVTMPSGTKQTVKQLCRNIYNRAVKDGVVVDKQIRRVEFVEDGR